MSLLENQSCEICKTRLISNELSAARKLIIFECKHAYHEACLPKEFSVSKYIIYSMCCNIK